MKKRSLKIQVLDINKNILDTCKSIRTTAKKYDVSITSISTTYLNKDKLCKGKYYFVSVPQD